MLTGIKLELAVHNLVLTGHTVKEISEQLGVSLVTIRRIIIQLKQSYRISPYVLDGGEQDETR